MYDAKEVSSGVFNTCVRRKMGSRKTKYKDISALQKGDDSSATSSDSDDEGVPLGGEPKEDPSLPAGVSPQAHKEKRKQHSTT